MRDLSSGWTGGAHLRLRGSPDRVRLAVALGPVRTAIRTVDDSRPPMTVDWAQVGLDDAGSPLSQSHTDFRGARIAVNPLPVLEDRLDPADQIDVCVGQALHEAAHSKHSRGLWLRTLLRDEGGREVPAFEPLRVAAWLLNVAEDPRVEGLVAADWPGFAPYFTHLLDWLQEEQARKGKGGVPDGIGHTIADRLRVAFLGARLPHLVPSASPVVAQEASWWADWRQAYAEGRTTPEATVQAGLDRLGEDPAIADEMAAMAVRDEKDRRLEGEYLSEFIERVLAEGVEGGPAACSHGAEPAPLDPEEADEVRRLVREGLREVRPVVTGRGVTAPAMRVRKPLETDESRRAYVGRPDPLVEAMRAALVFRSERPAFDIKLQRRGEVDDEELWRPATGDWRVFTEHVVEARPDTALGLLVDVSGSMIGGKLATAQRLAQILLAAAVDREGVEPRVWAHTGDGEAEGADVFTIWEPGDPASRLGLLSTLDNGNNYDSFALGYVVDRMRELPQPQKVIIVLSDGLPSGGGYGGPEAAAHVRQVVRWAESVGVSVVQIAIDRNLRPADQAAMYDRWVPYTGDRQLPRDLTRVLGGIV